MPRNHLGGPSTLRNRNRVTNKTRLRVIHGNIESDSFDAEDVIAANLNTAGVDAEDANEHHLQAVLSAAQQRQQSIGRTTRAADEKAKDAPAAYIPVPDAAGIVDNYGDLYLATRWVDPIAHIRSSESVDEAVENGLANGFTYFMDERDKEWLDRNNEEARGEGTSAQGAVSAGTTTRFGLTQRSAKAKGKEPDYAPPVVMSEDEFELVMGVFEKATHEKTEFLHVGLEQGMAFPPFADYQDVFSTPLLPSTFATFVTPEWIPPPSQLLRIAKVIYPHWRERRSERDGHRIIPALNFDEADTLNESYVCFRRREIKSVRKTRASQAASSEKLSNLQNALSSTLDLAQFVLGREKTKKEASQHTRVVWEERFNFVDLKRKFPSLGTKEDEELLHDKERVPKKPKVESSTSARISGLKLRTRESGELSSPVVHTEPAVKPKDRVEAIQTAIEREIQRQKERDHHWDDQVDNAYQSLPVPFAQRLFKWIPPQHVSSSTSLASTSDDEDTIQPRAVRIRKGRGGRTWVDRRNISSVLSVDDVARRLAVRRKLESTEGQQSDLEEDERLWRLVERWRFDADDEPAVGPDGHDEHGRMLVDDYDPKYLRFHMSLLQEQDIVSLSTDPTIMLTEGRIQPILASRQVAPMRPPGSSSRPMGAPPPGSTGSVSLSLPLQNGTPVSIMKKMQPPVMLPQMRISSNGGMRPSSTPAVNAMQTQAGTHTSPPQLPVTPAMNGVNGVDHGSVDAEADLKPAAPAVLPNGAATASQPDGNVLAVNNGLHQGSPPMRPKSQNQYHALTMSNGYHLPAVNGVTNMQNGTHYPYPNAQHGGLTAQQMQNLKAQFANMPATTDMSAIHANGGRGIPASYAGHVAPNGTNFNTQLGGGANLILKLPANRQMQWAMAAAPSPMQRPMAIPNGDAAVRNGSMSPSPNLGAAGLPMRTPSASGNRRAGNGVTASVGHIYGPAVAAAAVGQMGSSMSPSLHHSPSPMPLSQAHSSPPRPMPSPSLQQQVVGNVQGY